MTTKLFGVQSSRMIAASFKAAIFLISTVARAETVTNPAWNLDITKSMELAELHAFSGRMAEATVEENIAKSRQTMASMGPAVNLESTQAWISDNVNKMVGKSTGSGTVPDRVNTAAITVSQPIVPLAALYLKLKADLTSVDVSRLDAKQSKRNARFQGAESHIRALKADQFLAIAQSSLKLVEKQRHDGGALSRAGKLTNVDLLRLDLAMADASAQLAQAKNLRELAFVSLAETVGAPDYRILTLQDNKTNLYETQPLVTQNRETLVASAITNRSEVKSAEARVQMSQFYKMASDLDYLPMVNAFLKYERDFEKKDTFIPDTEKYIGNIVRSAMRQPLAAGPLGASYKKSDIRDTMTYGLSLKWALWDWGSRWFKTSEMAASVYKAKLARDQIESGIRLEATQAILDLEYALTSVETSRTALRVAEEAYKQQNARFESGSATVTDIITAERDQTRARGGLINAQGDLDIAWLKVFRVTATDPQTVK